MNRTGCQYLGFHLMYVRPGQMGMSQKPSGVTGSQGGEVMPPLPPLLPKYNAWSMQVGAMGQQLSQDLRHCKAVGRTQGAASLLPEL